MIRLAGASAFTWSESEQVYPFEKDTDGKTLYCKVLTIPSLAAGYASVAHGVGLANKIFHMYAHIAAGGYYSVPWPHAWSATHNVELHADNTNVNAYCNGGGGLIGNTLKIFLIYKKD